MVQENNQDWRIELYDGYLDGATFQLKSFVSEGTNDHEHCVFCWKHISDSQIEGAEKEGYCTVYAKTGQEQWLCKECFNDFNKQFGFKAE